MSFLNKYWGRHNSEALDADSQSLTYGVRVRTWSSFSEMVNMLNGRGLELHPSGGLSVVNPLLFLLKDWALQTLPVLFGVQSYFPLPRLSSLLPFGQQIFSNFSFHFGVRQVSTFSQRPVLKHLSVYVNCFPSSYFSFESQESFCHKYNS